MQSSLEKHGIHHSFFFGVGHLIFPWNPLRITLGDLCSGIKEHIGVIALARNIDTNNSWVRSDGVMMDVIIYVYIKYQM